MFDPEKASAVLGAISIAGLAAVNVYSSFRSARRQHNLADAEASKETLQGKYETELQTKRLMQRRIGELQIIVKERDDEIEYLRRQLGRSETN
jgi:hypothetical protein